ncbi:MAG: UDP-N-acetylmuramate dehydrogenase [Clostridia bacterium]|nr:UDP-N-acetylmuramate dehydrogenase [Clostridia bacterium]
MELYDSFALVLPRERLLRNEPMRLHTSFRVGGPADVMFAPAGEEELSLALKHAKRLGCPSTVIGNGSNLLVKDGGIRGLVIRLGDAFSETRFEGGDVFVSPGQSLARLSQMAMERGLTGLEFASGIPGSVGGAMAMNAGAYQGEMKQVTQGARLMDPVSGQVLSCTEEELCLGYRESRMLKTGEIVTRVHLRLQPGDKTEILAKMEDFNARRRDKQPLNYPSAGSTFKRPEGKFAGALIEGAGLKGTRVGGAQVSEKHAGFIINAGGATARDILDLIALVQEKVLKDSGVKLETEVRVLGEDA